MKNKLTKILGIVLAVVTVASVFAVAAPAAASTQGWSEFKTPSTTGMVLNTTITAGGPIAQGIDGVLYAYVLDGATNKLIKSSDSGRTWKTSGTVGQPTAAVAEIVASSTEANVVFYATATSLFKSVDGGASFTLIVSVPAGVNILSLDVAKWSGRYIAVVGVDSFTQGIMPAGVYYWDESLPFNNLTPVGTTVFGALNVLSVKVAPTFATDRAVVAAGTNGVALTVRMDINGGAWGATVADVTTIATTAPTAADIGFPSDFNALTSPIYFLVVSDPTVGGTYRIIGNTPTLTGAAGLTDNNISVNGAFNAGTATIMVGTSVGTAKKSSNSGFTWSAVSLRSAFVTGTAWVLLDVNYATNKMAYVLNVGGAQSAFNVSTDGMAVFNQWSLINTTIAGIADYVVSSNGDVFMITTAGADTSVWRQMVSAATPWERVYWNVAVTANKITVAADYATSKAVFMYVQSSAAAILSSVNNANKFDAMLSAPGSIVAPNNTVESLLALSATKVVVGSTAGIITTNTSAFWWVESTVGTGTITDLALASNGDLLAAGVTATTAYVAKSADQGATWSTLKLGTSTATITIASGIAFVVPADDYATTGNVFVSVDGGVYRWKSAVTSTWVAVNTTIGTANGLVAAPGGPGGPAEGNGMAYASDAAATDDVVRVRGTNFSEPLTSVAAATGVVLGNLQANPSAIGNVVLWAASPLKIWNYTDTLNVPVTGVAASNVFTGLPTFFGFIPATSSAKVSWNALTNATDYAVFVSVTKATTLSGAVATMVAATDDWSVSTAGALTFNATGLVPNTKYYISVWATAPVSSFIGSAEFSTPPEVPTYTAHLMPAHGSRDVETTTSFAWDAVAGAVSYDFQIAEGDVIPSGTATVSVAGISYHPTTALKNNTVYTWRVRAVAADSTTSAWVTSTFTTVVLVIPPVTITNNPVPTIIFPTQQPPVTITQGSPITPTIVIPDITITQVPEDSTTPAYIWIIVGVGALLTLAVIILIIRTRRVV